jgi:hypothetical protein
MTPLSVNDYAFVLALVIAAGLGIRSSVRMTRRYRALVKDGLLQDALQRLILGTFVFVAWTITVGALYIGALSVRRILGFTPIAQLAPVTTLVAIAILLIPAVLDLVVTRIERRP